VSEPRRYERHPRYVAVGGAVRAGWASAVEALPDRPLVLAVDGPAALDWPVVAEGMTAALHARGVPVEVCDVREQWDEQAVQKLCVPGPDADPFFLELAEFTMADLFPAGMPVITRPSSGVMLAFGPGAALCGADVLWWADLPKRYAEAAVTRGELPLGANLGRPHQVGELRSLFYTDWPVADRHRDEWAARIDGWLDVQGSGGPAFLDGDAVRATLAHLVAGPVRTRPYFNSTPWGGHWAEQELGFAPQDRSTALGYNTALGYELIAPESGVLVGDSADAQVELPFQLLCVLHPQRFLGAEVHARFGTSFPIRFDYLDTVGGGNLSLHCHPRERYMRERFGWPYTQHESYYVTAGEPGAQVFLGLRRDADPEALLRDVRTAAAQGTAMDPSEHVQVHPADVGQLFLIPAGTPHASGAGNLVLEVSATPYLYSLRFYDWQRVSSSGAPRPLSHAHAFANLDTSRRGEDVRKQLVPEPRPLRSEDGWREELIGGLPEMFYAVHRFVIDSPQAVAEDDTDGRFHILNVAAGDGVVIETQNGRTHDLAFAETITVPAGVGAYRLRPVGTRPVTVVKSLVTRP